ncbi:MAG TPA: hypothetical protein VFV34_24505 [Blastocatellia bacterium]|nr:hypothetical protein [Blastocatellia bacterium]
MSRMKILVCTFATLAMVMSTYIPAQAEFLETFHRNQPWVLQLASGNNRGEIAGTVYYLAGRKRDFDALPLVPAAATSTFEMGAIPHNVTRIIIEVDLPPNGSLAGQGIITVTQGAQTFSADMGGDFLLSSAASYRFVIEVAP